MKSTFKLLQNNRLKAIMIAFAVFTTSCSTIVSEKNVVKASTSNISGIADIKDGKKIKLALLLDTSNSMDGLIEQAKSQLWTIVNELSEAKCDNTKPELEIALYQYGNDNLPASEGYISMVTPLTTDLDQISEDLFGLTTLGGSEFCGQVIQTSIKQLDWEDSEDDLKIIVIAGNEPFTQGKVSYPEVCINAKEKGIVINTIFCGDFQEGINTSWKNGAILSGGNYMSISHNSKTTYIPSPYDDKIAQLNVQLNKTYVAYGVGGHLRQQNQITQDNNAAVYGQENYVKRAISKSKHVYKNSRWDLVDAAQEEDFDINSIKKEELPEEMQNMTDQEKLGYINEKSVEREKIKNEIDELGKKRKSFVAEKRKEEASEGMLDQAMLNAIRSQAKAKNFQFE